MCDDSARHPAPGGVANEGADTATAASRLLLDIVRRLRARERGYLAGLLHDGPIQELAAAALELSAARRGTGISPYDDLGVTEQLVVAAGRSLRCLQDELWPFPRPGSGLATALEQRTTWLLATPLAVDAGEGVAGLLAAEIQVVADMVELILSGMMSAEAPARALAAVRADKDLIVLELNLIPAADGGQASGDPAAVRAWLDSLAAAVQTCAEIDLQGRRWRVRMEIPRCPHHQSGPGAGTAAGM
jgi:hypothetical protein